MENIIGIILAGILAVAVYVVATQYAHHIHKRDRYMEAQIKLLSRIAEKQGVEKEEIERIIKIAATPESSI